MRSGKRYARMLAGIYCAATANAFVRGPAGGLVRALRPAVCPAVSASPTSSRGLLYARHVQGARRCNVARLMTMSAVDTTALEAQIAEQGNKVRAMKEAMKADSGAHTKEELDVEVGKLKALKAQLSPPEPKPAAKKPAAKKPAAAKKKGKAVEVKLSPRAERSVRIGKVDKFREKGINPYAYTWEVTDSCTKLQEAHKGLGNGEIAEGARTSIAGRIMAKRIFGKLAFYTLADSAGEIQLYLEEAAVKAAMGDDSFDDLKSLVDIGDWIGVEGGIKRTDKGELSVMVNKWEMLTKTILPLPDKYKGLTDVNIRYRRRYVDLIVNSEVRHAMHLECAFPTLEPRPTAHPQTLKTL
jgi:hypothetical protein